MTDLEFLNLNDVEFYEGSGGFVGLRHKDDNYSHIILRRIMPMAEPFSYISVATPEGEGNDVREIGILKTVDDLPENQRKIVLAELDNRYYSPEVMEVVSVSDKLGYVYMELRLKNKNGVEYKKNCAIKDVSRNIRMTSDTSVIIFDVDGNRYVVDDVKKLSRQSLRKLDAYLF
jgi:hypothetical protein